jgi:nucleotide-binding universal stress UspA family protein/osmotically-inducible protein OsmY
METEPRLILVPADFSASSARALRYAAALGERFGAHLLVIHADPFVPPVDFTIATAGTFDLPREDMIEAAREQLQTFAETNIPVDMPYDVRVIVGNPHDAILAQAFESGANVIVMGTHGRTGLRRLLFGSVTEGVIRHALVPVIAVNELASETVAIDVVVGRSGTLEERAAARYAGLLADPDNARFVDVAGSDDLLGIAEHEGADLIALGVGTDRFERVLLQRSTCPVLTMNTLAARKLEPGPESAIHQRILDAVGADPNVRVRVSVDGIVTLEGYVHTYAEKCAVEDAAWRAGGVSAVRNQLEVRLTIGDYRTDTTLERILGELIDALARMPSARPTATVSDGWVTLQGSVPLESQRQLVEKMVREVAGIRGLTNQIALRSPTLAG